MEWNDKAKFPSRKLKIQSWSDSYMNEDGGSVNKDDALTCRTTEIETKNTNNLALTKPTIETTDE